ncbi:MAG TPA: WGR domain-containing protein [Burkholderiales bacterium]|nr:WGR domain-containing protein [Burkholderiales bacterium]
MADAPFLGLLNAGLERGGFQADDVLRAVLPLFRQIAAWHAEERVAPLRRLEGLIVTESGTLALAAADGVPPRRNADRVDALQRPVSSALNVVGHARVTTEADSGTSFEDLEVMADAESLTAPVYIAGYEVWEECLDHHDALTDVFACGQLLASLACGLDFTDVDELGRFAAHRENLFAVNPRLHPVISRVIVEMTQLNRHQRAPSLAAVIQRLETYREQPVELDLAHLAGFAESGLTDRRRIVLAHLRDRLFDLSGRNRLLHFRPTQSTVNLTVASVPLVLDLRSIRLDQLLVWNPAFAAEIVKGEPINLGRFLRFEDQPYLPGALDRIIAEANRDRAEYGFSQLRLVIAFLRWHNLKEAPQERIVSPLLLLPVQLMRKKGVRDQYVLYPGEGHAEVNPALRHYLRQLYGIRVPESVDLEETTLERFHAELQAQIRASEPGVELRLVVEPQIELVYQRARQRLEQFRRRQKIIRKGVKPKTAFDYSYERGSFRPLGLQLFREKVLSAPLPLHQAAGGAAVPRPPQMAAAAPAAAETEHLTFSLREERTGNPYSWDFDLCSMTLGNFNYRKMSLVRDYGALLEDIYPCESFDRVFSLEPRQVEEGPPAPLPREEQWAVVQGDATQAAAVALAREGRSYIVQGPPGTGKSQTITNLIADYVARGKRVLFVCEKRAAIDVVYHRLHQQGLDELCCLIHDSQTDKKAFVLNLKQTYEAWLAEPDGLEAARERRTAVLKQMAQDLDALRRFDAAMRALPEHVALPLRELIHRLVELREHEPRVSAADAEHLPDFALCRAHTDLAHRMRAALQELADVPALAAHPFRRLAGGVIRAERPLEMLATLTDRAEMLLDTLADGLDGLAGRATYPGSLQALEALLDMVRRVAGIAARGQLALLDARSPLSRALDELVLELAERTRKLAAAQDKTKNWRDKLPPDDAPAALAQARSQERSPLRFVLPGWWRLKREVERRYDFSRHSVRPALSTVLANLANEHAAQALCDELRIRAQTYGTEGPERLVEELRALQSPDPVHPECNALRAHLLADPESGRLVEQLSALMPQFADLRQTLETLLVDWGSLGIAAAGEALRDLREEADTLPDLLPLLSELADAPPAFGHALRRFSLTPEQLEAAAAQRSLERVYRTERWLPRFDGRVLARHVERLAQAEREWLALNAAGVRASVRRRFRENVQLAGLPAAQLDADGKAFKKGYAAGRRELEHEFGKTMRYKSIRELAAGESGRVVRDLKPVWLMSPLSVSDTLPLQARLFDVVIFDEASQIPVEEAVPALYRAPQVIVVGDEMQLPPTSFFTAARDPGEEALEAQENGERMSVLLDADSLLNQSAKSLPATLLAWHYRSRSESLIGFSNAAFYAGQLYTIPERRLPAPDLPEIVVRGGESASVEALLERPISFHFLESSVYEQRRNEREATCIADLVRQLLRRNTGMSLGVVAFSEAQQAQIESALETLAGADADFAAALEAEYVREENDQFCGLFVKNLENVQGDERDIIVLSICYGPGPDGRMLMNFGPINQRGGEKRLNVIFSRARHHMAVVSSIRHTAITNDYNDGAAALKNFLRYAECASRGDLATARAVLEGLNPLSRKALAPRTGHDAVVAQLAAALRARGLDVDEQVGQSRFRCDLAVRDASALHYALGILVDTEAHYANPDLAERYVSRPRALQTFGWRIAQVLSRDWYHEPEAVLARVERLLRGDSEPPPPDMPAEAEPRPEPQPAAVQAAPPQQAPEPPSASLQAPPASPFRRFEFVGGNSRKFWEVACSGASVTVRFGRIGTNGQAQTKQFASEERAARESEKLIAEKLTKGYKEAAG